MSNIENAQLFLRTIDSVFVDSLRSDFTWNNINLRTVLGDMYDRYDKFNLCLNSVAFGPAAATLGTIIQDTIVYIEMSGLPFINQTYNAKTNNNTSITSINYINFVRSNAIFVDYNNTYVTFGKNQETCNINIRYRRTHDGEFPTTPIAFPHGTFDFHIVGIPNDYDNKLKPPSRIDNNTGKLK